MGAYIIKCKSFETDENGKVTVIHADADLVTKNGNPTDRKIKGTIHWVSAKFCQDVNVNLYDKLFTIPNLNDMPEGSTYNDFLNPDSLVKLTGCKVEKALEGAESGEKFQFVRNGYFCKDSKYPDTYNRVVSLKDGDKVK